MFEQINNYFTIEMLYYWVNLGVLPFWVILVFFPKSQFCKYFVTSIFPFFILSGTYIFMLYKSYLNSYEFSGNFNLYLPLLITYLIGPLGLFIYWIIRMFYAKSINLYD